MLYNFYCDFCKKEFVVAQEVEEEHAFICPQCKRKTRRLFCTNFVIKGWSPGNEIKVDDYMTTVEKALKDDTPATKTMFEVAVEQLIKRAEKRGEDPNKALSEVLGVNRKKEPVDKEELAKRAKKQREMIDKKMGI